jgi:tetratricopeptide (TPR) repeat protein
LLLARQMSKPSLPIAPLINLGSTLREMKQYDQGILYAQEAVSLTMNGVGTDYHKAGALDSLIELYVESKQPELALSYGESGLAAARASGSGGLEANLLLNVAHAHRDLGAVEEAMRGYETALDLSETLGDHYHRALALMGIAELHRRGARYGAAKKLAQRALDIFVGLGGDEAGVARDFLATLSMATVPDAK